MCWNARVSLNTFAFALFVAILAYVNKKHHDIDMRLILFVLIFSSIQLVEAAIWINIDNPRMNRIFSNLILVVLLLEIIVSGNLINNRTYRLIHFLLTAIACIIYLLFIHTNDTMYSKKGKNGHLEWTRKENIYTIIVFSILFLTPLLFNISKDRLVIFMIGLITLIISLFTYYKYNTFSSMWCWASNVIWIYILYKIMYGCSTF